MTDEHDNRAGLTNQILRQNHETVLALRTEIQEFIRTANTRELATRAELASITRWMQDRPPCPTLQEHLRADKEVGVRTEGRRWDAKMRVLGGALAAFFGAVAGWLASMLGGPSGG